MDNKAITPTATFAHPFADPKEPEYTCATVPGGWQTQHVATGQLFGPAYADIQKLWKWQAVMLANRYVIADTITAN